MSDDDRDIDIESDVGVFPIWQFIEFVLHVYFDPDNIFANFQAENDSDSRTHARNSVGGSGYYSQVNGACIYCKYLVISNCHKYVL